MVAILVSRREPRLFFSKHSKEPTEEVCQYAGTSLVYDTNAFLRLVHPKVSEKEKYGQVTQPFSEDSHTLE